MSIFKKRVEKTEPITITLIDEESKEEIGVYEVEEVKKEVKEIKLVDENDTNKSYFDEDFQKELMDMYPGMEKKAFHKALKDACTKFLKDEASIVLKDELEKKKELAKKEIELVDNLLTGDKKELAKKEKEIVLKDSEDKKADKELRDEINKTMQEYYDNA